MRTQYLLHGALIKLNYLGVLVVVSLLAVTCGGPSSTEITVETGRNGGATVGGTSGSGKAGNTAGMNVAGAPGGVGGTPAAGAGGGDQSGGTAGAMVVGGAAGQMNTAGTAGNAAGGAAGMAMAGMGGMANMAGMGVAGMGVAGMGVAGMGVAGMGVAGMGVAGMGPAPDRLIAYVNFDGTTGPLDGFALGPAFEAAYEVQNDDTTGYVVASEAPLTFANLLTTANYGEGGSLYQGSGAPFSLSTAGPFAPDLDPTTGRIGKPGTTLWMSGLLRRGLTTAPNSATHFGVHASTFTHADDESAAPPAVTFGFFGDPSIVSGKAYWSLRVGHDSSLPPMNIFPTNVEMVPSQAVFVVIAMHFDGANSSVSVYVNPSSLGGAAPVAPTLTKPAPNMAPFRSLYFYPGNDAGNGAFDEFRIGTSYAAVTPVTGGE